MSRNKNPLPHIEYTLTAEPEDTAIRGNALASGDDDADTEAENQIIADLDSGNEWAWCTAHVTATLYDATGNELAQGHAYLGCCSYESRESFMDPNGYYPDLCDEALDDLRRTVRDTGLRANVATHALAAIGRAERAQ